MKNLKSKLKELEKAMKNGPKDVSKQFSDFVTVRLSSFYSWVTSEIAEPLSTIIIL